MSSYDFRFVQGDDGPPITDNLTFADGTAAPIAGATITPIMRSMTSPENVSGLTAAVQVTDPVAAQIQWSPTAADTTLMPQGAVLLKWLVAYQTGQTQTFPTNGYLWGYIEPKLADMPMALVSLPDVKDYLNTFGIDRTHDDKILGYIQAATPIIENIVGPIMVRTFDEWHDGGSDIIQLWRTPSTALGTQPILRLLAASEYRGPIEYPLQIISSPAFGQIYSVFLDQELGTITRRTAGGRTITFMPGHQNVHITYQAGLQTVPPNIRMAALEAIRDDYQETMATGSGSLALADTEPQQPGSSFGYSLNRHVLAYVGANRRHPSFA